MPHNVPFIARPAGVSRGRKNPAETVSGLLLSKKAVPKTFLLYPRSPESPEYALAPHKPRADIKADPAPCRNFCQGSTKSEENAYWLRREGQRP